MQTYLEFEKPIAELETRVSELRDTASSGELDLDAEIGKLEAKSAKLLRDTYAKLTPWQKAQVRAIRSGRTSRIMSPGLRRISFRWPGTAPSRTILRSSAASPPSAVTG
jgi:hypothetical protein